MSINRKADRDGHIGRILLPPRSETLGSSVLERLRSSGIPKFSSHRRGWEKTPYNEDTRDRSRSDRRGRSLSKDIGHRRSRGRQYSRGRSIRKYRKEAGAEGSRASSHGKGSGIKASRSRAVSRHGWSEEDKVNRHWHHRNLTASAQRWNTSQTVSGRLGRIPT